MIIGIMLRPKVQVHTFAFDGKHVFAGTHGEYAALIVDVIIDIAKINDDTPMIRRFTSTKNFRFFLSIKYKSIAQIFLLAVYKLKSKNLEQIYNKWQHYNASWDGCNLQCSDSPHNCFSMT